MKYRSLIALMLCAASLAAVAQDRPSDSDAQSGREPKPPSFSELDTDGNGLLSLAEFSAIGPPPFGDINEIFNDVDSDQDGFISEAELKGHKPPRPPQK